MKSSEIEKSFYHEISPQGRNDKSKIKINSYDKLHSTGHFIPSFILGDI